MFASTTTLTISNDNLDPEPKSIVECRKHSDWVRWRQKIEVELDSLKKQKSFCLCSTYTSKCYPSYKWVFIRRRNENNEVVIYKARLLLKGFRRDSILILIKHILLL